MLAAPTSVQAYDLVLRWTVPPEPNVAGYFVYTGPFPATYVQRILVRPTDSLTRNAVVYYRLPGLQVDLQYYIAVTAFNTTGLESGFSNEKSVVFHSVAPPAAKAGPDLNGGVGDILNLGSPPVAGVSYFWQQTGGPPALLSDVFNSQTQFQAFSQGNFNLTLVAYDTQGLAAQDTVGVVLTSPTQPPTIAPTATRTPSPLATGSPAPTSTGTPPGTPSADTVRLYLTSVPPSHALVQPHGSWYAPPIIQVGLSLTPAGSVSNSLRQETSSVPVDMGLLWAISAPLAAAADLHGFLDWGVSAAASASDAALYWHVDFYVLVGDTDTLRCTWSMTTARTRTTALHGLLWSTALGRRIHRRCSLARPSRAIALLSKSAMWRAIPSAPHALAFLPTAARHRM